MKNFLKKSVLYALAFIALWGCSVLVLWVLSLFFATIRNNLLFDGFKTGALAFAILFVLNLYSEKKKNK